jgi:DegV family protein with EDD domain
MNPTPRSIAVVTDSTSDLPPELVQAHNIHVVPLNLIMGDKTWRDGVDIDPPAFYRLLVSSKDFPTTSQPNVAAFQDLFVELAEGSAGIVAVLVSSDRRGTVESAQLAAANLPDIPIEIIDSRGVSASLGLMVLAAVRAADEGGDLKTVANTVRALIDKTRLYFVVDTLEYLHRGGRIGAATKLLGSALNLKPILAIENGVVEPVGRVRTHSKARARVKEILHEQLSDADKVHMAVFHVAAPDEVSRFRAQLEGGFHPVEMVETECGPVIGAHVGPGTVGVAFYAE